MISTILISLGCYFLGLYIGSRLTTIPARKKTSLGDSKVFDDKTFFVEPISTEESFKASKDIGDFIKRTK
jgi:hypothetical protein